VDPDSPDPIIRELLEAAAAPSLEALRVGGGLPVQSGITERQQDRLSCDVHFISGNSFGAPTEVMALFERTHRQHPADRDVLLAFTLIARDRGELAAVLTHAQELVELDPAAIGRFGPWPRISAKGWGASDNSGAEFLSGIRLTGRVLVGRWAPRSSQRSQPLTAQRTDSFDGE